MTFREKFDDIFKFLAVTEQKEYYEKFFPLKKWLLMIGVYAQSTVVNNLIWKREGVNTKLPLNMFSVYRDSFDFLFKNSLARENFFIHLFFFGLIYHPDGLADFMKKENFHLISKNLKGSYSFKADKSDSFEQSLEEISPLDLLSISDQSSYVSSFEIEEILQKARRFIAPSGFMIWRSVARMASSHQPGYRDVTDQYSSLIAKDKIQLQKFQIFQSLN